MPSRDDLWNVAMNTDLPALPFIDEYHVFVAASADTVWRHLCTAIGRPDTAGRVVAQLLAAEPRRASGEVSTQGATLPGFSVQDAVPGNRLVLAGHHRFSEYTLNLTLAEWARGTRLSASTYARFPGIRGRLYRAMVLGTRGHRVLLMRLLRGVRRAAEADLAKRS
jgi:hypothetical protein